ncbi:MAG: PH domain-containing protein [Methanobacterium sp.]|nr:PH domain-containing protein [Methanobacterium sp.]
MKDNNRRNSHSGERVLLETPPRFIANMKSAIYKFIIVLILLYFSTTIIQYSVIVQDHIGNIGNIPIIQTTTTILIITILFMIFWIFWDILSWKSKIYTITNKRVIIKTGIIRKKSVYMYYDKIQDIILSQNIIEKLLYSGNIEIFGGHDRTSLILIDVPSPGEVENMINRMIEGDDHEFETYKPKRYGQKSKKRESIMDEYDKKFKL